MIGGNTDGPDRDTLKNLRGMLPSAAKHIHTRHRERKAKAAQPRKACMICCKAYDFVTPKIIVLNPELQPSICPDCQNNLSDGYIALVSVDRFAFVKHDSLKDHAGHIIKVEQSSMDRVDKKYKVQKRNANPD